MRDANFLRDLIGTFKTDARYVLRQAKRVGADLLDGVLAISFVDTHGAARADPIGVQEDHDVPNHALLRPRIFDAAAAHRTNAFDLLEAPRIAFDNFEYLFPKFCDELLGVGRANAFDHAAAEVFFDAFASRWG